jgi:hypothetical protein
MALDGTPERAYFQDDRWFYYLMALHTPDPDDPGAPVHRPAEGPPPSPAEVRRMLEGVIDPELHASIVEKHVAPPLSITAR